MNISEIRKKAQKQKDANGVPAPPPALNDNPPVQPESAIIEDLPRYMENAVSEVVAQPLQPGPETRISRDFDPLAVILAGRASVRAFDESAASIGDIIEADDEESSKLLCFRVAGEFYGIDIMEIREIIKPRMVTEVPRMPSFVSGVLSLRGVMVPVFNLRLRLGHPLAGDTGKERIVVINRGEELRGLLVDEVIQVASIGKASLEPPPSVLDGIDRDFVKGIGRIEERMLILLDLENILDMNLH
jgi:purine-binding chemotaxis protein CheW